MTEDLELRAVLLGGEGPRVEFQVHGAVGLASELQERGHGVDGLEDRGGVPECRRRNVALAAIRSILASPDAREGLTREEVTRRLQEQTDLGRLSFRTREEFENYLITAAMRRISDRKGNVLFLATTSIDDYDLEDVKKYLLAAVGSRWTDRTQVARLVARYLGFRRTGQKIEDKVKSAINGCIRQGRLESDSGMVRKGR